MNRYFKKQWESMRGNEYSEWGKYFILFETSEDYHIKRQIEIYENGNRLRYHSDKKFDDYGGLGIKPLDIANFTACEINKSEFEMEWEISVPKKVHQEIIKLISEYLANHYDQRFGQALFNLGINEFVNKVSPEKEEYRLRDIHGDSDKAILNRIQNRMMRFKKSEKRSKKN